VSDRFFTDSTFVDDQITLSDDQAHHLINVMRAKLGDAVVLFDRQGNEYQTQIVDVAKKKLTLKRIATTRPQRKLATSITIVAALPKGDRQKFLIEKLVELGVEKFVPLTTPRSVAQVNAKVLGRISKQIIEATKQCRRSYLMEVSEAKTVSEVLAEFDTAQQCCFIAHPYDAVPVDSIAGDDRPQGCVWLIGPEGGFAEQEVAQAVAAGWQAVSFGEIILRVETAALVAAMESRRGVQR
jgi:16S rRNA (uracil1498-N3)-methyltransferase